MLKVWIHGELMGNQRGEGRTRKVALWKSLEESFRKDQVVNGVKNC